MEQAEYQTQITTWEATLGSDFRDHQARDVSFYVEVQRRSQLGSHLERKITETETASIDTGAASPHVTPMYTK